MADDDRITLIIEGLPEDDGQVRLGAFMNQLQNLNATITKLDRENNDGKSATYYRIAELSYSSPVRVVLEPQALPKHHYIGPAILDSLVRLTTALDDGSESDLSKIDSDLLEDIRGLARPVGKSVKSAALIFRDRTFDLTEKVTSKVDLALAVDEECEGAIEGMLEQINLHHGANVFYIYPVRRFQRLTPSIWLRPSFIALRSFIPLIRTATPRALVSCRYLAMLVDMG